jgi:type I restriction enzyme S subunit
MITGSREKTTAKLIAEGVLKIGDGYRAKNSELTADGLPFARAGNINNGFQFSIADRLPHHYTNIIGDKTSLPGDTVFNSKGTVGRFGFVTEKTEKFVYSPQLCFWRSLKHEEVLPRFVYYWMHGQEFLGQVEGLKAQTDMADYVNWPISEE